MSEFEDSIKYLSIQALYKHCINLSCLNLHVTCMYVIVVTDVNWLTQCRGHHCQKDPCPQLFWKCNHLIQYDKYSTLPFCTLICNIFYTVYEKLQLLI